MATPALYKKYKAYFLLKSWSHMSVLLKGHFQELMTSFVAYKNIKF